jgi:hypothetical protein
MAVFVKMQSYCEEEHHTFFAWRKQDITFCLRSFFAQTKGKRYQKRMAQVFVFTDFLLL